MSAHHFFLPSVDAEVLTIDGDDARHALKVLRIAPGERITISDGAGSVASAETMEAGQTLVARVTSRTHIARTLPYLALYQGLPKSGKLEALVQAGTQLGIDEIVPVRMRRSIPRWDPRKARTHAERLRAVGKEAAMQSRRAWLPVVGDLAGIDVIPPGAIVLHEEASIRLSAALPDQVPERIDLVVGPEGGLDAAEVKDLDARGCSVVSLGPLVLRTELAGIAAAIAVLVRYRRLA